jgi:hypothetical protein
VIRLPSGGGTSGSSSGSGEFKDGKYSPTFLRVDQKTKANVVEIPINRSRPIGARTDAENGYLNRPDNTGRVIVPEAASMRFGIRPHLLNGRLTVFLTPVESAVKVGDVILIRIELKDPAMAQSVRDEFSIRIVDEESPSQKPKKNKSNQPAPPKAGDKANKEGGDEEKPTHGLPSYRLLTSDGRELGGQETEKWPEGFSETDGGYAQDLGNNQVMYFVNYDNAYHIRYRQQQKGDIARNAVTEKFILGMRVLMLSFENSIRTIAGSANTEIREHFDDFRRMSAKAAASTVLALAEILPKIVDSGPTETE